MNKLNTYLNTPIPRYKVLLLIASHLAGTSVAVYAAGRKAGAVIEDQQQRIVIFREAVDFLLDHADSETVSELNQNLDYWRVIREMPPFEDEEENKTGTWFEEEFGYDIELAETWLHDVYKAPEMHAKAQEFLDAAKKLDEEDEA